MRVIERGHIYELEGGERIAFIRKESLPGLTHLTVVHGGTTTEEVLEVVIDRTEQLNKAIPCSENERALLHLRAALLLFKTRTEKRVEQGVEGTNKPHDPSFL